MAAVAERTCFAATSFTLLCRGLLFFTHEKEHTVLASCAWVFFKLAMLGGANVVESRLVYI